MRLKLNKKEKILKIANLLDHLGYYKYADDLDDLLEEKPLDGITLEIPKGDLEEIREIYKALGESLK